MTGMKRGNLNRRQFASLLAGAAAGAMTMPATRSRAQAPLDLGGYGGPALTSTKVTLKFLRQNFPDPVNAWYAKKIAEFSQAYPNIEIAQETVPFGDLQQKVQLYIQSGKAPDIMMGRSDLAPYFAAGKIGVDLRQFLSSDYLALIQPTALDSVSYRGQLVLMPWEIGVPMIVYNKELFAAAGMPTPPVLGPDSIDAGWTVEEWLDTLRGLKKGLDKQGNPALFALEASTLGNGGPGSNYAGFEGHFIRMMGDPAAAAGSDEYRTWAAVSEDGFTATDHFNSAGAVAGMTNYQTLFREGLTPQGAVPQQFRAGTAAVGWQALSLINRYTANPKDKLAFEWGVTVLPKGRTLFGCNSAEAPFVHSGSEHAPEAAAFLSYLCNTPNRTEYHLVRGSVPVRDDLMANLPLYKGPAQQLAIAASKRYVGCPQTPGWADYFSIANSTIKDIALGADVRATLDRAAGQVDARLNAYRRF